MTYKSKALEVEGLMMLNAYKIVLPRKTLNPEHSFSGQDRLFMIVQNV